MADLTPIEQFTLVLLRYSAFEDFGDLRSWKGYDWEVMNRLHEKGLISNPVSKAKSVVFTDAGRERAQALLDALVGTQDATTPQGEATTEGRKKKVGAVVGPNKKRE